MASQPTHHRPPNPRSPAPDEKKKNAPVLCCCFLLHDEHVLPAARPPTNTSRYAHFTLRQQLVSCLPSSGHVPPGGRLEANIRLRGNRVISSPGKRSGSPSPCVSTVWCQMMKNVELNWGWETNCEMLIIQMVLLMKVVWRWWTRAKLKDPPADVDLQMLLRLLLISMFSCKSVCPFGPRRVFGFWVWNPDESFYYVTYIFNPVNQLASFKSNLVPVPQRTSPCSSTRPHAI